MSRANCRYIPGKVYYITLKNKTPWKGNESASIAVKSFCLGQDYIDLGVWSFVREITSSRACNKLMKTQSS
jgi:hypothetical protein